MPRGRIYDHFDSRMTQARFLTFWTRGKQGSQPELLINQTFSSSIFTFSEHNLFTVAEHAVKNAPPIELGKFLSVIRKCADYLGLFLLQHPNAAQLREYCAELRDHVRLQCPNINSSSLNMDEIADKVGSGMMRRRMTELLAQQVERRLLPINTPEARCRALLYNNKITHRIFFALLTSLQTTFRKEYNLWQFIQVSRGFRHEEEQRTGMPDPEISNIQITAYIDEHENYLVPGGNRIPLEDFCKPAKTVPADSTCSICIGEVKSAVDSSETKSGSGVMLKVTNPDERLIDRFGLETSDAEDKPVVTACNHYFHEKCLDQWVNDSVMMAANLCPSCRSMMCRRRPRVLWSMLPDRNNDMNVNSEAERYVMALALEQGM